MAALLTEYLEAHKKGPKVDALDVAAGNGNDIQ